MDKMRQDLQSTPSISDVDVIDQMVYSLSQGDIVQSKAILESITMREALEWIYLGNTRQEGHL